MPLKDSKRLYHCPHCHNQHFRKKGFYYRKVSKTYIPRYFCFSCQKHFSTRTLSLTFRQKRPDLNQKIKDLLNSGVSLRRTAEKLNCHYQTVYKKFLWLSHKAEAAHRAQEFSIQELQFDEMESIEHTKLKPLTIALAVSEDYRILGVRVGSLPAKGHLSEISIKKYGPRENQSEKVIKELLQNLKVQAKGRSFIIKSDAKASYEKHVKRFYPEHPYQSFIARENKEKRRELKYTNQEKRVFDPLFAVNQRMAKLRGHIKRLTRRSWCTTKIQENLEKHLYLYIADNNGYQIL